MPVDFDAAAGKLMMRINHLGDEFLYVVSLPAGVGSNPIGLDRGEMGETHLVRFERVGPKVLLVEENTRFRALSNDPNEAAVSPGGSTPAQGHSLELTTTRLISTVRASSTLHKVVDAKSNNSSSGTPRNARRPTSVVA